MARRFSNKQEAVEFLQTLPMNALFDVAADALMELQTKTYSKITVTEEQFKTFFRVKGIAENGEPETRGRKPKDLFQAD